MAGEGWNEGAGKYPFKNKNFVFLLSKIGVVCNGLNQGRRWMMDMIGKTGHSEAFQDDYKEAKKSMKGETEE